MEEIPVEEPSLTDQECMDQSEMQEQLFDDEKCHAPLVMHKESPILGLVSTVTEQAYEDDAGTIFQDKGAYSSGLFDANFDY